MTEKPSPLATLEDALGRASRNLCAAAYAAAKAHGPDRKRAQRAARRAQERYAQAVDNLALAHRLGAPVVKNPATEERNAAMHTRSPALDGMAEAASAAVATGRPPEAAPYRPGIQD